MSPSRSSAYPRGNSIPLLDVPNGQKVRVFRLDGEMAACQRLREMGFCEEAEVKVLVNNGSVVCQVCGSKVGLSRQIADAVLVEPFS